MDTYIFIFEIVGTIAFAISGALTGMRKQMDIFGTCVLGVTTAVGGGIVRDLLLGVTPVSALVRPEFILIALVTSIFIFPTFIRKHIIINKKAFDNIFLIADSIGLGVFTAYGFLVAYNLGLNYWFLLIFVALITGVGGGVLRDIFAQEKPIIFVKHVYATASLIGAIVCFFANRFFGLAIAISACLAVVFIIRILATHFGWGLPKPTKYNEEL